MLLEVMWKKLMFLSSLGISYKLLKTNCVVQGIYLVLQLYYWYSFEDLTSCVFLDAVCLVEYFQPVKCWIFSDKWPCTLQVHSALQAYFCLGEVEKKCLNSKKCWRWSYTHLTFVVSFQFLNRTDKYCRLT